MYAQSTARMLRMSSSLTATRLRFIVCILAIISSFIVAYTISDVDIQFFDTFITPENGNIGSEVKFSFSYIQACKGNISTLVFSLFVNFTILMLFMNFFSKSYSKRPNTSNNNKNKKQSTKKKKA